GGFSANIDDRRAGFEHGRGMGASDIGPVEEFAAVGEAVGRDVEDAHDLGLVEPQGARAAGERGVAALQIGPLGADFLGQAGQRGFEFAGAIDLAGDHLSAVAPDHGEAAGEDEVAAEADGGAVFALRAFGEPDRTEVMRGQGGQASRVPSHIRAKRTELMMTMKVVPSGMSGLRREEIELADMVERFELAIMFKVPERPAVAGWGTLKLGAEAVDRAGLGRAGERAVG